MSKSILLLGATGAVGSECLKLLASDAAFSRVVVVTRGAFNATHPKVEHHRIDFENPATYESLANVDAVICTLGTTVAKVKSPTEYRRVDFDYPLHFAELARRAGAAHYLIVSTAGANLNSKVFYYRLKAKIEQALEQLEFPTLTIVRPSLIMSKRTEFRPKEIFALWIARIFQPLIPLKYRPVQAAVIARALVESARASTGSGVRVITNQELLGQ